MHGFHLNHVKIDKYQSQFVALSASSIGEYRLNDGGRVLLPAMALQAISNLSMVFPLQFKLTAYRQKPVYAAVLEFNAEMGTIVLPDWMFQELKLRPKGVVRVETCNLEEGHLVKLQPHKKAFVLLQDPRRVLEQRLNKYPILSKGSTIVIHYANQDFLLNVVDLLNTGGKSVEAVLTARADAGATELKVEFERPLDMPDSPPDNTLTSSATPPTSSNVIGSSAVGGVQFKPFVYKPPSLTTPVTNAGVTAQQSDNEHAAGNPSSSTVNRPAFVAFSSPGRTLATVSSGPANDTLSSSSTTLTPSAEQLEKIREKRLQALLGRK